jgi:hypothetical protein
LTGEEPSSEGRVRDDCDAELSRCLQESEFIILDVKVEGRVFDLESGNGMDCVGPTEV